MRKHALALTASALLMASGVGIAHAQQAQQGDQAQQDQQMMGPGMGTEMMQQIHEMMRQGRMGPGMMRERDMMGRGMMDRGIAHGMMGHGGMARVVFALMDADGDGTVSREEFLEANERIFNHMGADGDGELTLEQMLAFMHGPQRADVGEKPGLDQEE